MGLTFGTPPAGGRAAIGAALSAFSAAGPALGAAADRESAGTDLQLTEPHHVFELGLNDVADGRPLAAARPAGWRYLFTDGERAVEAAEVSEPGPGGAVRFSSLNRGLLVEGSVEAIRLAEEQFDGPSPEAAAGDYEIRMLRVPALYVSAIWLKSLAKGNDRLIPIDPAPKPLRAGEVYEERAFFDVLRQAARRRQQYDDAPVRSPEASSITDAGPDVEEQEPRTGYA